MTTFASTNITAMLAPNLIKNACFATLTFFATSGLFAQNVATGVVEVIFTQDMDKAGLERIREEVKAKGIDLQYTNMSFKDDSLQAISFSVETQAGSGTASTDQIKPEGRFGFRYDPRPEAVVPFGVGSLIGLQ